MAGKAPDQGQKKSKMSFSIKFSLFCLMVAGVLVFPTTLLLCACLVPSFVAAVVDANPQKTAWVTVGSLNFAGTIPAWFNLWQHGNNLQQSINLLTDTHTYIIAYTASLVGWVIYYNVTPFIAGMMVLKSEKRLKDIDKRQRELIRKWGTDVTGTGASAHEAARN